MIKGENGTLNSGESFAFIAVSVVYCGSCYSFKIGVVNLSGDDGMGKVMPYKGIWPQLHETVFMTDGVFVIGDVHIGAHSSVWFNTVIRGDVCPIRIGEKTSVQDNSTLHVTHDTGPLNIGNCVTIGHGAVLHACTVKDYVLIGMGAVLLDDCVIEPWSIVAAGSLVRQGFTVPSGMLVAGVPAKVMRPITDAERRNIEESPENYVRYSQNYKEDEKELRKSGLLP